MDFLVILGILFLTAAIISYAVAMFECKNIGDFTWGMVSMLVFLFGITFLIESNSNREPKAIDVYRGNTTLQITYTDSIPTDTVVVFKKK